MGPLIVMSNYRIHVPAKRVSTIVRNSCKSLLVEWQEIRPTQPLTIEFQDLLLAFINKPPIEDGTVGHTSRLTVTKERPMSAPQRFRRSQYGAARHRGKATAGSFALISEHSEFNGGNCILLLC